jgi:pimeloyl-ACP methyl ester carboxylesterase
VRGLFLPGWGATAGLYAAGLPEGWEALELPSFRKARGDFLTYRDWVAGELVRRRTPVALAGHSMGGALALLAAIDQPDLVEQLILVSPAGLPLTKSMKSSMVTFTRQVVSGRYPFGHLRRVVARAAAAPWSALQLARTAHQLDVRSELELYDTDRFACIVVACATDTLTPPGHCRKLAAMLDAEYREVDASDGHIWPITHPRLLAHELSR